uniref:RRM domain-containing protein n=1 Tax=Angiostrongylus cantonensis TaxID=6313 RepID=A0A158P9N8_ANGCA
MHKASLSTGWTGAEKEFFVRNIPEDFIDWDLFRIFYKYGAVHSVRIPSMKSQSSKRYGFVTMEDLNGADEVRSHLKNGEYLITETGLQLLVRVVDSPHPCQSVDDGFVFHIIPIDQKLGGEYADLQRAMNKFCAENPSLADLPKVGQYTLFVRSSIAYRALCNSKMTVYLVDTGEIVPIELSQLWNIDIAFTQLPSLVIPCGISAIIWSTPSAVLFNNCRNALEQWSASYVDGLTATATHYAGLVNMICLEAFWNGG